MSSTGDNLNKLRMALRADNRPQDRPRRQYTPSTKAGKAIEALLRRLPGITQDTKAKLLMRAFGVSIEGLIEMVDTEPEAQRIFSAWLHEVNQLEDQDG